MKFKLLAGAALAAVFAASGASAQEGWYGAVDNHGDDRRCNKKSALVRVPQEIDLCGRKCERRGKLHLQLMFAG